ncbi:MAG: hypothetical protein FWF46_07030, partial [Oscillospiraceae bacterium]|nr:hypothetical protein [Oscillospiraceae bacterium]
IARLCYREIPIKNKKTSKFFEERTTDSRPYKEKILTSKKIQLHKMLTKRLQSAIIKEQFFYLSTPILMGKTMEDNNMATKKSKKEQKPKAGTGGKKKSTPVAGTGKKKGK